MRAVFLCLTLLPLVFAFGQASLRVCSASTTYSGGANTVTATATCTNVGGQAVGSWTRSSTTLSNSDTGVYYFTVSGTFTTTCPANFGGSSVGTGGSPPPAPPVASWALWRTDVNPAVKVPNCGGPFTAGTYGMLQSCRDVGVEYPSAAQFQLRVSIAPGSGSCTASISNGRVMVDQPAK